MRIIAGEFKGRTLKAPTWDGLRPTSDRLRETLFNILGDLDGLRVLDVCAGTGALGLEALSRGAVHAVFLERDPRAVRLIEENAAHCRATNRCVIIRATARQALDDALGGPFDLVLLDPPYDDPDRGAMVTLAAAHLAAGGRLVLEHAVRVAPPDGGPLTPARTVRTGDSALTFYRAVPAARAQEAGVDDAQ